MLTIKEITISKDRTNKKLMKWKRYLNADEDQNTDFRD